MQPISDMRDSYTSRKSCARWNAYFVDRRCINITQAQAPPIDAIHFCSHVGLQIISLTTSADTYEGVICTGISHAPVRVQLVVKGFLVAHCHAKMGSRKSWVTGRAEVGLDYGTVVEQNPWSEGSGNLLTSIIYSKGSATTYMFASLADRSAQAR